MTTVNTINPFVCGIRKVVKEGTFHRVVCATCDDGSERLYLDAKTAQWACVNASAQPCNLCGAR